jgi:signal transduction histidine kinase
MRNLAVGITALCVLVGVFGAIGVLDGPYVGAEYEDAGDFLLIARVAPGSPAEGAGFPMGARLVSIAGIPVGRWDLEDDMDVIPDRAALVSNFSTQAALGRALRPGRPVAYVLDSPQSGLRTFELRPERMPLARALSRLAELFLPALFCLGIGLAVMMKKPGDRRVRFFFAMMATASLVFLTFGSWSSRDTTMRGIFFFPLAAINECYAFPYFPVLFFRFCLSFPRDLGPAKRAGLMAALYLSPIALVAVFLPRLVFEVQPVFWGAGLLGGCAVMARQYFTLRSPAFRAQVKWILWGAMIFGICMVIAYTIPILLRRPGESNWFLPTLVFLVVPLTFAFAILRYRLMDIDALFDATFVYTITAGLLIAIDALVALGLGLLGGRGGYDILSSSLAILVAIVLYAPLRGRIALLVKRLFRREIYEPAEVASRVADRLLLARGTEDCIEALRSAVDSTLHPVSAAALRLSPVTALPDGLRGEDEEILRTIAGARLAGPADPGPEAPFILDPLVEQGLVPEALSGGVAVPIRSRGELAVLLAFGPKGSRSYYSAADMRLIAMIARQTSLAVEGAILRLEAERSAQELHGERERVSREIHDGVGGTLSNAIMLTGLARVERDPEAQAKRLSALEGLLTEALADMRNLVWALHEGKGSLPDLAAQLRDRFERSTADRDIAADFRVEVGDDGAMLNARERLNLVRAAQELVANGLKHSGASRLSLTVKQVDGSLELTYEDDGRGFDTQAPASGYGMRNLAKRCGDIGAALRFESAPGNGCRAQIRLVLSRG